MRFGTNGRTCWNEQMDEVVQSRGGCDVGRSTGLEPLSIRWVSSTGRSGTTGSRDDNARVSQEGGTGTGIVYPKVLLSAGVWGN